jgi:hypothetical protein
MQGEIAEKREKMADYFGSDFSWREYYELPLIVLPMLVVKVCGVEAQFTSFIKQPNASQVAINEVVAGEFSLAADDLDVDQFKVLFAILTALNRQIESIKYYGYPISDFLRRYIRAPNDDDLMEMISIDGSLSGHPAIQRRINTAKALGDSEFQYKLLRAMKEQPHRNRLPNLDLRFVLYALKVENALDKLTEDRAYELFCLDLKIFPDDGDAARSLWKFIKRWEKDYPT